MEQKNIWEGKWKYGLMVVCLVAAIGVFGYSKISSNAAKLQQRSQVAAVVPASQASTNAKSAASIDTTLGAQVAEASTSSVPQNGAVVASKNGTKYFPLSCKSSRTVKEANKVTFGSAAEAEAAGYTLAKNCAKK